MEMPFKLRANCNSCFSTNLVDVLDLGLHPLADTFLKPDQVTQNNLFIPLVVQRCEKCHHCFTKYYIPPSLRYRENEYSYETGNSAISREHFQEFCRDISEFCALSPDDKVIDIGGNDGTFLNEFAKIGINNLTNVEPSKNIAELAGKKHKIKSINTFYDKSIVDKIDRGTVDLILATNVLNHYDDLSVFFDVSASLLKKDKYLVIEVPDLHALLERGAFETIYHEHVNYFSMKVLQELGNQYGLSLIKWAETDYMCGSLRAYFIKDNFQGSLNKISSIADIQRFRDFALKIKKIKFKLLNEVSNLKLQNKKIVGLGAATKGNTLLNYVGLDFDVIDAVCDHTELKVGKLMPGSLIEIIHDDQIPQDAYAAIILPSNLTNLLKRKFSNKIEKFIEPLSEGYTDEI